MSSSKVVKKHVPWYSMAEWNDVFEKAYSNNYELQDTAYKRMCIWKMRCPNLPVGVECTMEILQIILFDGKANEAFDKKDLQLMYSTILMRFVNQITHLYSNELKKHMTTCYEIAKMYGIPDWIVNIRHDTAHKNILPSLEILKTAVHFALDWLYKNYWTLEAKEASDFVLQVYPVVSNAERKIQILLTLWKSCKLYKFSGYHTVGDIPNHSLRTHLYSLKTIENVLNINEDVSDELVSLESYFTNDGTEEKSKIKLTEVFKFLIKYLNKLLPTNCRNDIAITHVFVDSLINGQLFLPSTFDHKLYCDNNSIHRCLSLLWRDILELYHESHLITNLLENLAEISINDPMYSRQLVAACWLSYISQSIAEPGILVDHYKNTKEDKLFATKFINKFENSLKSNGYDSKFHNTNSKPSVNLNLSKSVHLDSYLIQKVVEKVLMSPNKTTSIFISSLLNLINPPLELSSFKSIVQLVETYTNSSNLEPSKSDMIYTPEMLPNSYIMGSDDADLEDIMDEETSSTNSIWSKKYGVYDWSNCPFGRLP